MKRRIEVEVLYDEESRGYQFNVWAEDDDELSGQEVIDAISEYFMLIDPGTFENTRKDSLQ